MVTESSVSPVADALEYRTAPTMTGPQSISPQGTLPPADSTVRFLTVEGARSANSSPSQPWPPGVSVNRIGDATVPAACNADGWAPPIVRLARSSNVTVSPASTVNVA